MAHIPGTFRVLLRKVRSLPNDGCRLLYVHSTWGGKNGVFYREGQYPEFEGEKAWFLVRKPADKKELEFIRKLTPEEIVGPL